MHIDKGKIIFFRIFLHRRIEFNDCARNLSI